MPIPAERKPKSAFRRLERWAVGLAMGFLAFFIERAVLRSIRDGGTKPKPAEPTAFQGTGSEIRPSEPDR